MTGFEDWLNVNDQNSRVNQGCSFAALWMLESRMRNKDEEHEKEEPRMRSMKGSIRNQTGYNGESVCMYAEFETPVESQDRGSQGIVG